MIAQGGVGCLGCASDQIFGCFTQHNSTYTYLWLEFFKYEPLVHDDIVRPGRIPGRNVHSTLCFAVGRGLDGIVYFYYGVNFVS